MDCDSVTNTLPVLEHTKRSQTHLMMDWLMSYLLNSLFSHKDEWLGSTGPNTVQDIKACCPFFWYKQLLR
jgi:hypothetical protein